MARRRSKPGLAKLPPQGDVGPITAAQMAGATLLALREDNGTEYKRKRRDHALEIMCTAGRINSRQMAAGLTLHALYCETQRSPDSAFCRIYVDSSPRPGDTAVMQAERVTKYAAVSQHIPRHSRAVVQHVVIHGRELHHGFSTDKTDAATHCTALQVALDIIATEVGY